MNAELVSMMTESIMNLIAEWSMPLTFEEYALLMERLSREILVSLNAWKERYPAGYCCYWGPAPCSSPPMPTVSR